MRSDDPVLLRLEKLHPKVIDLSLGRIRRLLDDLGNPEARLPPVIHVAGTNGKGSVVAFLRAFFEAAGHRVHVYTSPHLVNFNERIRLAGRLIDDDELKSVLDECEKANRDRSITFFEITTAAAFLAFSRHPADVVLLETGLGGRLDATNLVERPALTVLTQIALDHQSYLGETVEAIAGEKAGILKAGVACVSANLGRGPGRVVRDRAKELHAEVYEEGKDWFVTSSPTGIRYHAGTWQRMIPAPGLAGKHQLHNAGLAMACTDRLSGFSIPEAAIALGLRSVHWPGRLQFIERGGLAEILPEGFELWLDGGHNPAAAKALAQQAREWRDRPLYMIFGQTGPRDPQAFLKPFVGRLKELWAVPVPGHESHVSPDRILEAAGALNIPAQSAPDLKTALQDIPNDDRPGRVLICGSLYLAGTALELSGKDYIPA